jgi:HEAT repeat protein
MARKRSVAEERLHAVVEAGERAGPALAMELRPFLRDKVGFVAAAAASLVAEHELLGLEGELEEVFRRFLEDPVKTDPGCRAKLAAAEALRTLDVRAPDVYLRGVAYRQLEPSYGPPLDTASALRVCCAAALLETRHPMALTEVAPLLADPEPNARSGVASVLGTVGGEGCEALLRLKVRSGDDEPEVIGACLDALLRASFDRGFPFMLDALRDSDDDVLRLGLLALGESREERALPPLREYAESVSTRVREAALLAISISRLPAANDYLVTLVERAPERRALEAIAALEPRHGDAALMDRVRAVASTRGGAVQSALLKGANGSPA